MVQGRVSLVMVNWNGIEFLDRFVPSVLSQTYPNIEFFVIDNASEDGSVDWLKAQYPKLRVLRQDRNFGYAGAHNLGIRLSTGEFYMPLNCDLVLTPTFVAEMVGAIKGSHETGSVTGKLLRLGVDGTPSTLIDSTGHVLFKTRTVANRGDGERDTGQYDTHTEVFGVSGTAPLYRRAMLESVRMGDDYLDEDYFAYWEDVDLDWRAQHAGWRARYAPRAVAHHVRLGSLAGRQDWARMISFRNRYLTLVKNDRLPDLIRDLGYVLVYENKQWHRLLFQPRFRHLWRMVPSLLRSLPGAVRKCRRIMATSRGGPARTHFVDPRYRQWRRLRRLMLKELALVGAGSAVFAYFIFR